MALHLDPCFGNLIAPYNLACSLASKLCRYTALDPTLLPPLWLILKSPDSLNQASEKGSGKDSGRVHSTVRQRWLQGDPSVQAGMDQIASKAAAGM